MRMHFGAWTVSGIALCCSIACGSSAPPPTPPPQETAGHEEPEPPPPPPPPPASVHVVHASPDPGLSTLSVRLDEDATSIVSDLAASSASASIDVTPGTHAVHVLGVASVETGEATEVLVASIDVTSSTHPIVLVFGEPSAEPPLTVSVIEQDASSGATRVRIVHGLIGVAAIDVCVGGAPIADGLAPGAISPVTPLAEGAVTIVLHAASESACHGRALGTAHATLAAGTSYVATLSGHAPRRGRMTGSIVLCSEGETVTCENAAIGTR